MARAAVLPLLVYAVRGTRQFSEILRIGSASITVSAIRNTPAAARPAGCGECGWLRVLFQLIQDALDESLRKRSISFQDWKVIGFPYSPGQKTTRYYPHYPQAGTSIILYSRIFLCLLSSPRRVKPPMILLSLAFRYTPRAMLLPLGTAS